MGKEVEEDLYKAVCTALNSYQGDKRHAVNQAMHALADFIGPESAMMGVPHVMVRRLFAALVELQDIGNDSAQPSCFGRWGPAEPACAGGPLAPPCECERRCRRWQQSAEELLRRRG